MYEKNPYPYYKISYRYFHLYSTNNNILILKYQNVISHYSMFAISVITFFAICSVITFFAICSMVKARDCYKFLHFPFNGELIMLVFAPKLSQSEA